LRGVEAGALQLAVVPAERLRLVVFEEQLAVVGALEGIADDALDAAAVEAGAGEEQLIGSGDIGHGGAPATGTMAFNQYRTTARQWQGSAPAPGSLPEIVAQSATERRKNLHCCCIVAPESSYSRACCPRKQGLERATTSVAPDSRLCRNDSEEKD